MPLLTCGRRPRSIVLGMNTIPLTLTLMAAVTLGCMMGLNYLRGVRSTPIMIASHLILGVLALEQMAMILAGTSDEGDRLGERANGRLTLYLFFATLVAGLVAALIRHRPRELNVALAGHVAAATAGVVAYLTWVRHL